MKPRELIGKQIEIQLTDIIEMPDNWLAVIYGDDAWFNGIIKSITRRVVTFEIHKEKSTGIMKIELNRIKYIEYEGNKYKFVPLVTFTQGRLEYGDFQRVVP